MQRTRVVLQRVDFSPCRSTYETSPLPRCTDLPLSAATVCAEGEPEDLSHCFVVGADELDFQVRAQTGSLFLGNTSDSLGHGFSLVGYNEWRLWAVARALSSPGDTIVEVGANIGTETVGFSDIVGSTGRVIAFEPVPSSVTTLERALSRARYRNVEIFPHAVGARAGSVRLSVPAGFPSRAQVVTEEGDTSSTVEAKCVTLDSMERCSARHACSSSTPRARRST